MIKKEMSENTLGQMKTAHSVEQQEARGRSDLDSLLEGPLLEIKCSAYKWTIQACVWI